MDHERKCINNNFWGVYNISFDSLEVNEFSKILLNNMCIAGCNMAFRRELFEKIVPIPFHFIHDSWIAICAPLFGQVAFINKPTMEYRQHGNNQVGTEKISHKFTRLDDVRNLFIDVKLQLFQTYVNHEEIFPENLKKQNKKALNYFKDIQNKKQINFKNWSAFHMLYKNETIMYYLENFIIMNLPIIGRILFKIRHIALKILGKR